MSDPKNPPEASGLLLAFTHTVAALLRAGHAPPEFARALLEATAGAAGCDRVRLWVRDEDGVLAYDGGQPGHFSATRLDAPESGAHAPAVVMLLGLASSGGPQAPEAGLIPLDCDGERVGVVSTHPHRDAVRDLAPTLALGLARNASRHALRERVKELTCLYEMVRLASEADRGLDALLADVVRLLPPAWQYPDVAEAAIVFDGRVFSTADHSAVVERQTSAIVVDGRRRGHVEVGYREPRPPGPEGPFLRQERRLLDTIAKDIGLVSKRLEEQERRTQLEAQLRHADRLATIGQLAAGIAHELNEPLANVLGYIQLAQRAENLPDQVERDLDRAVQGSLYAREILRRLLQFACRPQPGAASADLNEAIRELVGFLEPRWRRERIAVECRLAVGPLPVALHRIELQQVLMNLLVNAAQAMVGGGRLTIETRDGPSSVQLRIEDSGVGMDESVRRRIFLPFFTTKKPEEGTGLGLATVHDIVTARGGTIEVSSEPGRGTCFDLDLPRPGGGEH